jgi:hypothetical protein
VLGDAVIIDIDLKGAAYYAFEAGQREHFLRAFMTAGEYAAGGPDGD